MPPIFLSFPSTSASALFDAGASVYDHVSMPNTMPLILTLALKPTWCLLIVLLMVSQYEMGTSTYGLDRNRFQNATVNSSLF